MGRRDKLFSYLLFIGFILFVVVFLFLVLLISRFTLSDVDFRVKGAEDIEEAMMVVEDISFVEDAVRIVEGVEGGVNESFFLGGLRFLNVTDVSFLNVGENRGVFTVFFDRRIGKSDGFYYVVLEDISEVGVGDKIVYAEAGESFVGGIVSFEEDGLKVLDLVNREVVSVDERSVLGVVFFEERNGR